MEKSHDTRNVLDVVNTYAAALEQENIPKRQMDPGRTFASLSRDELLAHAHYLCDNVRKYATERTENWADGRKVGSHLTSVQLCLSFAGWHDLTLRDLMDHNRPKT